jgi:hypothetical protein
MFNQSDAMRVMAVKYLRLAKNTKDRRERSKFFDYAMVYAQFSKQSEPRETSRAMAGRDVERRDVPERGDVPI